MALMASKSHVIFALYICWMYLFVLRCRAAEPAWNGQTPTGSKKTPTTHFGSYYVPPGAKGYDSSLPLIHYTGLWLETYSPSYTGGSCRRTSMDGAAVSFKFHGSGIEAFGTLGPSYGRARVYLDGRVVEDVNLSSDTQHHGQRLYWNYDLPMGQHTFKMVNLVPPGTAHSLFDIDSFVVTDDVALQSKSLHSLDRKASIARQDAGWSLRQEGSTGVHAMQISVISDSHAIIIDKVEHNPLTINGHPAWGALYNLKTHALKPLNMESNSFCAGGAFLRNGTLVNVGGNPVVEDRTSSADFGDVDGLQAIRLFHPCNSDDSDGCDMYENPSRLHMASPRWYNTAIRISDGSVMIIGGSKKGGWINNDTVNNPTVEYYPPKDIHGSNGLPIVLPFLQDTLASNLFPIAFVLPDGNVFLAANQDATIYDWKANTERRLPSIPNGVRVTYPMTGTALLLPLVPENNYSPEILICGGSDIDDSKPSWEISSQDKASAQCSRILLTEDGISSGWQVEEMPEARMMPDAVLLPTGDVVIVNGGGSGISGYGNVKDQAGASNADNPVLTPVLYNPGASVGQRFSSQGMPTSSIPRLYHSVATLTPSGDIMVAGSNPNLDRSSIKYGTEYRVEWISPPYMHGARPQIKKHPTKIAFGKDFELQVPGMKLGSDIKVVLMDLGYVTHAVHAGSRMVYLNHQDHDERLTVVGPPNENIYSPGPGFLFVVQDGIPSLGHKVMVGDGEDPPFNEGAMNNVLRQHAKP